MRLFKMVELTSKNFERIVFFSREHSHIFDYITKNREAHNCAF